MKRFDNWKNPLIGVFLAMLMLVSAPGVAQFVPVGTPSGTSNTTTTYPSPFGNWYWGARQQFLYPASELTTAGLAAGNITAIQFDVSATNGAIHNNYYIAVGQTATSSLTTWEGGLTNVYGPVAQTPVVGLNTFTFSSPFVWDGTSNVVVEICFENTAFSQNSIVEWTTVLPYNGSLTYRADGTFAGNGGCNTTLTSAGQNETRRPMTSFEGTLAPCGPLASLAESNVTATSADIAFANISGDVYIEYGPAGFTPGTDQNAGGGTIVGPFTTSPQTISGLTGSTLYDVYLRQDCGSEWSGNAALSFATTCTTYGAPYAEGFEGFTPSTNATWPSTSCITAVPENTTALFRWNQSSAGTTSGGTGPLGPQEGSVYAFTEGSSGTTGAVATLDLGPIDVSSLTDPVLKFYYHMFADGFADMGTLNAQISPDGVTYVTEFTLSGQQQATQAAPFTEAIVSLAAYSGQTIFVRFEAIRGTGFRSDIAIDDINVEEAPSCITPLGLTVDAFTATSADVSWSCAGCTGDFYVEYGAPGFTPGTDATAGGGTVVGPITGTSTTISPLTADTDYQIYVRQDCGVVDGFSDNGTSASVFTGACSDGGPSSGADSNLELVLLDGIGTSQINHVPACPGFIGVEDLTAQSADVSEILFFDLQINYGTCGGNFGGAGSVWVDWNENLTFEPGELIGSDAFTPPFSNTYSFTVPGGTALGPKKMRVIQQESGALPLDPCGSFTWGSVIDFTLNVVPPPACSQPVASFNLLPDCDGSEFSIEVIVTDAGSSTGGLVDITNNGGEPAITGVGPGTYTVGPFIAGPDVVVTVVNLDDNICNLNSSALGTDCVLCTGGGPSSTADSNIELVEIDGFAGSGFSHVGCSPAVTGVQDLTTLSVDIPNGFSYDVTVDLGTCGGNFGGAGTVWVDWNGDFNFSAAEVVGTSTVNPSSNNFTLTPPPGTPVGPKVMRVMQEEGGSLPLDPCGSFTWGSVMDFTVNVIADPGCLPPDADLTLDASSCGGAATEYFINVDILSVGDSPGGEVTISNSFDANTIPNATVAGSPYVYGPFPSGTALDVNVEHLGNALCNYTSSFSYTCPPDNDDCSTTTPVALTSGVTSSFSGTTEGATESAPFTGAPAVWEAFTVSGTCNNVTVEYCGNAPAFVEIFTALAPSCPADVNTLIANDAFNFDDCGDSNPTVFFFDLPAGTYYLPIAGETANNVAGPYSIDITSEDCPPPPTASCVAGFSNLPGSFITTGSPVSDVLNVGPQVGGSVITDMDVVVNITHTFVGDLTIELTSPCGTTVVLQDGSCGGADNMEALYNDDATASFSGWCVNRFGPVVPLEALSAFNDEVVEGDWTLTVTDNAGGDDGTLVQWCLVPTLDAVCLAPQVEVIDFDNESISVDLSSGGCFDPGSYNDFDITWTGSGGGSASGVSLPYVITGLLPGTEHLVDVVANCDGGPSPSFGVAATTLNCAPADLCTYELTLSNTGGTGFGDGIVTVNNGWTTTDYIMDSELASQSWTILACPGNPISLALSAPTGPTPSNDFGISLVNSDDVEVFSETGPTASTFFFVADGCPECGAANNIQFSRLAADLIDVNWNNVALPANVTDIQIDVLDGGFTVIASETVPAGTTSASIDLGASYPFEFVTVQITTLCVNGGTGLTQAFTSLPACDAADQCEYLFDMSGTVNGWEGFNLDVLLDGVVSIGVALDGSSTGTQSVFACALGSIDVTAQTSGGGGIPDETCVNASQWPTGTITIPNSGAVTNITTCNFGGEYSSLNLANAGTYNFTSAFAGDYFTFTDASNTVIAAGPAPLEVSVSASGTYRLHVNTDSNCGTDSSCRTTTGQFTGPPSPGCENFDFSLVLNPATDNVTLVSQTDFCDYESGDQVYSGVTCPSCFTPIDASAGNVTSASVDVSWTSNNVAGVDYTIYVGLPGFTPGVDEVSSASGVTTITGAQGPETVGGLSPFTAYEAVVIEDCDSGNDPSGPSNTVPFTTEIDNDDCADVTPVSYTSPNVLVFNGSSVGANDNSVNGSYGGAQAWEAFTLTNCAQNLQIEYCGSVPVFGTAFTGISTGCPAEFPTNYLVADESSFPTNPNLANCPDGNPILLFNQLSAGTYYIPVFEGVGAYQITITSDQCEGCTDPAAINFDPEAEVDDGSCIIPVCDFPVLNTTIINDCVSGTYQVLLDIGTEGDAPDYDVTIGSASTPPFCDVAQTTAGFPSDPTCEAAVCGNDGFCCTNTWDGLCASDAATNPACTNCLSTGGGITVIGTFVGGTTSIDLGSYPIGTDIDINVEHNTDATCDQTISVGSDVICGCTDPLAINFSPLADEDDGSCVVPDCTDPPTEVSYCYINNENTSFEFTPTTPGENIILDFTQGSVESNTFDDFIVYDGSDASAPVLYSNPGATTSLVGLVIQSTLGNGLFITITSDGSISCSSGSYQPIVFDMYCGFIVVEGCTDINAVNYDPEANVNDGSCVYAPANDDCANAQTLTPAQYPSTQNVLGTLAGASENGATACVGTNGPDVFYTFNVPLENHYWVNLNPFGGFSGVVEVLDACDGTVVACENAPPSAPFCDQAQSGAGFSSDPACEAAVCGADSFCCTNSWDAICASDAATQPACTNCLSTAPAGSEPISVFIQNLPAGDYIVRIRDYFGSSYLTSAGQFLVNVQSFPTAKVQDDPAATLFACNTTDRQLEDFVGAIPQLGQLVVNGNYAILDYEWFIAEQGGTFQNVWQRGAPNYASRLDWLDMEYNTTYNVYVRVQLNVPGVGPVWGVHQVNGPDPHVDGAQECTISTSTNITLTELLPAYQGTNVDGNPYQLCDFAIASNVFSADNFRWRFEPTVPGPEIIYERGTGNPSIRLSWVDGLNPTLGVDYNVSVQASVDGQWSGVYGTPHLITMGGVPNVAVRPPYCGQTYSPNGYLLAESVCEADFYRFKFTPQFAGATREKASGSYALAMATINPPLEPGTYNVQVQVRQNGVLGDYSPSDVGLACEITISGPTMPGGEAPVAQRSETIGNATLFPNPNAGSEVRMELDGLSDGNHEVMIQVYDVYGKLIQTDGFGHEGSRLSRLVRFENELAMGVYMLHIVVDGERFAAERLIVK